MEGCRRQKHLLLPLKEHGKRLETEGRGRLPVFSMSILHVQVNRHGEPDNSQARLYRSVIDVGPRLTEKLAMGG